MTNEERMKLNGMQKLIKARQSFLNKVKNKSGVNIKLEYDYFELKDIVPIATGIFNNLGLLGVVNLTEEVASMSIYNVDNLEEPPIVFSAPYIEASQIYSNAGKEVTMPIQARGATITYFRRYLWMMVLDIVESDPVEEEMKKENVEVAKPKKQSKPKSQKERKEIKEELTAAEDQADELQIKGLKAACKKLVELDKDKEEFVQTIAMKTKGMTEVTRDQCEKLVNKINDMIAEYSEVKE